MFQGFSQATGDFLWGLSMNNDRAWFQAHRQEYEDALLLAMPLQIFCKPDCRGLCPTCGANLHPHTCTCQEGNVVTGPFSALKDYVLNNEEV